MCVNTSLGTVDIAVPGTYVCRGRIDGNKGTIIAARAFASVAVLLWWMAACNTGDSDISLGSGVRLLVRMIAAAVQSMPHQLCRLAQSYELVQEPRQQDTGITTIQTERWVLRGADSARPANSV